MAEVSGLHHVALACRDLEETHRFYTEVLGLRLVRTEVSEHEDGWLRHLFYDLGGGSALAFFDLHGVGEPDPLRTEISTGLGLPPWVNHVALRATGEQRARAIARLDDLGIKHMTLDHGWCVSTYVEDPNGITVELCEDTTGLPDEPEEAERLRHATPADLRPRQGSA
jgi:catechol 2,3-dioxygenase-like lactoylglutathione lyase family enzyme